jgi:hypothetical protein
MANRKDTVPAAGQTIQYESTYKRCSGISVTTVPEIGTTNLCYTFRVFGAFDE